MLEQPTSIRILKEAQDLIQRHGFFGLSLQDLADRIRIRKPSLYAHYDSKEALTVALLTDYREGFLKWTSEIEGGNAETRIKSFFGIYDEYLVDGKVCPHAALALDGPHLPASILGAFRELRKVQVAWLSGVLSDGVAEGTMRAFADREVEAEKILQRLVGAELGVRVTGDRARFEETKEEILQSLKKSH
jgi:TetR/AcrR family transcriptional repressor of nem operon